MKNLAKKYPNIDFNNLNEKDIIYFCRNALSYYNKDNDNKKKILEKEILDIIKSKNWDWNLQDIDKNTILTYPIYNGSFDIVKYLLETKKYNIKEYDKSVSNSLSACITIFGDQILSYFLSFDDMNIMYRTELAIKCYVSASKVEMDYHKNNYLNKALTIFKTDTIFSNIVNNFICFPLSYENIKEPLYHLLDNHPLDIESKINIVKEYCNSKQVFNEVYSNLENWLIFHDLNKNLLNYNLNIKKPKI